MQNAINITDWLMVAITFVYVVATILICYFNKKTIENSENQLKEMKLEFEEMKMAKVVVYFKFVRQCLLCFVIENIGLEPAYNVKVRIDNNFINGLNDDSKKIINGLNNSNMYLASKQRIYICFGSYNEFNQISQRKAIIKILYNQIEEEIEIDISNYGFSLVYDSEIDDISKNVEKIRKANEKLVDKIKEIKK